MKGSRKTKTTFHIQQDQKFFRKRMKEISHKWRHKKPTKKIAKESNEFANRRNKLLKERIAALNLNGSI